MDIAVTPLSRAGMGVLRTTLVLPENLNRNIEVYSASRGISKNEAMLTLISGKLEDLGYQPDQLPHVSVHYGSGSAPK